MFSRFSPFLIYVVAGLVISTVASPVPFDYDDEQRSRPPGPYDHKYSQEKPFSESSPHKTMVNALHMDIPKARPSSEDEPYSERPSDAKGKKPILDIAMDHKSDDDKGRISDKGKGPAPPKNDNGGKLGEDKGAGGKTASDTGKGPAPAPSNDQGGKADSNTGKDPSPSPINVQGGKTDSNKGKDPSPPINDQGGKTDSDKGKDPSPNNDKGGKADSDKGSNPDDHGGKSNDKGQNDKSGDDKSHQSSDKHEDPKSEKKQDKDKSNIVPAILDVPRLGS